MTSQQSNAPLVRDDGTLIYESGRDYRPVAPRLELARQHISGLRIINSLFCFNEIRVVVRCDIFDGQNRLLATGHAEEIYGSSQINVYSAMPNAETSACGRALAFLGYVPSQQDMIPKVIDGKEYTPVMARVHQFRQRHPRWTLSSQILYHDDLEYNAHGRVVAPEERGTGPFIGRYTVKAEIRDEHGNIVSTGHEEGKRTRFVGDINHLHLLEQVETSAYGRALAFIGYHGQNDLASYEEVYNARNRQQQAPHLTPVPTSQASAPAASSTPAAPPQDTAPQPQPQAAPSESSPPADKGPSPAQGKEQAIAQAKQNARAIADELNKVGYEDLVGKDIDPKNPPSHPFFTGRTTEKCVYIAVHCPCDSPLSSQLPPLGFVQDLSQPQIWYRDFPF